MIKQCFRKINRGVTWQMPGEESDWIYGAQGEGCSGHRWRERGLNLDGGRGHGNQVRMQSP